MDHLEWVGAFLFALVSMVSVSRRNQHHKVAKKILDKTIQSQTNEPLTLHPEVDPGLCAGCGNCTRVCPEGDILKLINHQAVLVSPTKCVGHGECEQACPTGAIKLVFGTKTRGMDIPRITSDYETNVKGLYIVGELGGMGLIRNAVKQGAWAAKDALKKLTKSQADVDLAIIGAGPAGLAASLAAVAEKKSYVCLEQNSFGGTVYNFPRQKIVMTIPAVLPVIGAMKFPHNKVSKEELLTFWNDVRRRTGLRVQEGVKFETVEKAGEVFKLKTNKGSLTARKVILAMGVRGAPRRLGLKNEDLPKVTYNLIDPEQYIGKKVAVVGGGNAGVEAAQMLGNPKYRNQVILLVRGTTFDRCNDENKRIIEEMESRREVKILYSSSVVEIGSDSLKIKQGEQTTSVPNDFLFIFAGAELPHKLLMGFGIQIEKKFGEALSKKART